MNRLSLVFRPRQVRSASLAMRRDESRFAAGASIGDQSRAGTDRDRAPASTNQIVRRRRRARHCGKSPAGTRDDRPIATLAWLRLQPVWKWRNQRDLACAITLNLPRAEFW